LGTNDFPLRKEVLAKIKTMIDRRVSCLCAPEKWLNQTLFLKAFLWFPDYG
jgi:hypothetical protein